MKKANPTSAKTNQLARLTKEQQVNPLLVLENFFTTYHLKDVREVLWEWLTAGLTNERAYNDARDRSNLIFLYEHVESLAEAAYVILKDRKPRGGISKGGKSHN